MAETKPPFFDEMVENMAEGSALLGQMVRTNTLAAANAVLPPPQIWDWFVKDVTFRFIDVEHRVINDPASEGNEEAMGALDAHLQELLLTLHVCAKNKQLGLQSFVQNALKTRVLHLPLNFDHTYGGAL